MWSNEIHIFIVHIQFIPSIFSSLVNYLNKQTFYLIYCSWIVFKLMLHVYRCRGFDEFNKIKGSEDEEVVLKLETP